MAKMVYVHIDTTSNAVLSRGITPTSFYQGIVHQPKNLLLLDPSSDYGEYESHTGMKILKGEEAVKQYFEALSRHRITETVKWIDFTDPAMLKELTPMEISELLYFGHMKTQLHSPFFYKLQNNFVYFDLQGDLSRVYYRYLDEYYRILADKLTHLVLERINDKKSFFRKSTPVDKLKVQLLQEMKGIFQEGILFCFETATNENNLLKIPIYLVEDAGLRKTTLLRDEELLVAYLIYNQTSRQWSLDYVEKDLLFFSN
ncbi:hypothetical protein P7G51_08790 [Enterococcus asini]|uniref:hypothetical protein n=1 Tax=Enterococcus asini TaxID=57732 RepID=UPI002890D120|nr:hypothetical protein [Enterococcus asini]MDT2757471.1 hypothetical protein [Enterococcus asini]